MMQFARTSNLSNLSTIEGWLAAVDKLDNQILLKKETENVYSLVKKTYGESGFIKCK